MEILGRIRSWYQRFRHVVLRRKCTINPIVLIESVDEGSRGVIFKGTHEEFKNVYKEENE